MNYLTLGILAHVDAGKTTLSEGLLYVSGAIRSMGRVDSRDTFLDTDVMERQRGITIFSKQAVFPLGERQVTLLDTPGHVDFSPEMERTLQVLDYAVLVISGADGVQAHTRTVWTLLKKYNIPVFLFINKMDQRGTDPHELMRELQQLDGGCVHFGGDDMDAFFDSAAMCDEALLDAFLETGVLTDEQLADAIAARKIFPCYFGSALKMDGVDAFLQGMDRYMKTPPRRKEFGARVFKIARDEQGNRLTYMKITGGILKVRDVLKGPAGHGREDTPEKEAPVSGEEAWEEKVSQIRIYSGVRYDTVQEVRAGQVCAVMGLHYTMPGDGLGAESGKPLSTLIPVLNYRVRLPREVDAPGFLPKLRQLEEEEPQLHVQWDGHLGEIQVQVMGQVQLEILQHLIAERFGIQVSFDPGAILYKETIANTVEGVGHFEPLRHYAEVHVRMEPGERGSGLTFAAECSQDVLALNWQRLILTHLQEREHKGVLTGSPITDIKFTLTGGRAHLKHTEGGDFRQATYRAVRQGLMEAESVLLEPWYSFRLEVPPRMVGRAMTDVEQMQGTVTLESHEEPLAVLTGRAPVSAMKDYPMEVAAYTRGLGKLSCTYYGYLPCHNAAQVCGQIGYDPLLDDANPSSSVFCAHGAGYAVPWDQVKDLMHVEADAAAPRVVKPSAVSAGSPVTERWLDVEEVDRIVAGASGANKKDRIDLSRRWGQRFQGKEKPFMQKRGSSSRPVPVKEKYLLVDGYNIIFAWDDLKELAKVTVDGARGRLADILCNYQAFVRCHVILVFDAYRVQGHAEEAADYHNITVVYTKEAETADQYIERFAHANSRQYDVTVATSDGLEQIIIRGEGCRLWSASDLREEVLRVNAVIREYLEES